MDDKELYERGLKLRVEMFGREAVDKRMNAFGEFGKPLQHIINAYAYGDVWQRSALPSAVKSLVMVAMMAAAGHQNELRVHLKGAVKNGCTAEQIQDPYHAVNAFYDALVKVDGYQSMRITEAAQKVQRSGFPEAYADHEADGRALASALTGYSRARFSCVVHAPSGLDSEKAGKDGLTPRAEAVRADLHQAFGDLPLGGFAAGGVTTGHMKGSAHYDGRAIDVFVRPVNPANKRTGWAIASYLVAHAGRLDVEHVIFDKRIWTAGDSSDRGWRVYDPGKAPGDRKVLEHRDHVHVDVAAGS